MAKKKENPHPEGPSRKGLGDESRSVKRTRT